MSKHAEFIDTPIPLPAKVWDWGESKKRSIVESNEKLVPLGLCPDKILSSSQYYIQNIRGALPECYGRETVQKKLIEAVKFLPSGYRFVLFDCWRPLQVQQSLFDKLKQEIQEKYSSLVEEEITKRTLIYVALPSTDVTKPSPHNTGGAVDLTIVDENGLMLNMGTGFDDNTEKARTVYFEEQLINGTQLNIQEIEALRNRRLLFHIMTSVGFTNYVDEWWHFDYGNQNWAWINGSDHAVYGKTGPSFVWNKEIK